jgi:hypothetical protein
VRRRGECSRVRGVSVGKVGTQGVQPLGQRGWGRADAEQHLGQIRYLTAADGAGHEHGQPLLHRLPAGCATGELHHGVLGVEGGAEAFRQADDLVVDAALNKFVR